MLFRYLTSGIIFTSINAMEEGKHLTPPPSQQSVHLESPDQVRHASHAKSVYIVVGFFLLVLVGSGTYLFLSRHTTVKPTTATHTLPTTASTSTISATQPTPVISPVTQPNVDQTLHNTDTTMQQSINQVNTDLNQINSIDKTKDSTNGL